MNQSLASKRALVTGGSRGIGAAIVKRLAAEGAHVAFTYGKTEKIAGMVAYLAGPEAGFITGASLTIDGGFNA